MNIGSKVICIDDTISVEQFLAVFNLYPDWIKKGEKYTVRGIKDNDGIVAGLLLEEKHNPPTFIPLLNREQEPAFATWRFREMTYQEMEADAESKEQTEKLLETLTTQN